MQFTDLRIPIATRMQVTIVGPDYKPQQYIAQLLGYRKDVTVLAHLPKKPLSPLHNDSNVSVRVGLQSAIIRFDSTLQYAQEQPFMFLHLSYPTSVEVEQQLRRSPRFVFEAQTTVALQTAGAGRPIRGQFTDISLNGARLTLTAKLADTSGPVVVTCAVFVAGAEQQLQLMARIKSAPDSKEVPSSTAIPYGISFIDTTPQQQLLLQALCYELQANNAQINP